jgi:hypothetical protein
VCPDRHRLVPQAVTNAAGAGVGVGVAVGAGVAVGTGVAVGAGVAVDVAVGAGVAVALGLGVGVGVGAGVAVAVAVGVGVGSGVGAAEVVAAVERTKTLDARIAPSWAAFDALPVEERSCTASIVCGPSGPLGTVTVALNVPFAFTVTLGIPSADPSQVSWTFVFALKPDPTTAIDDPDGALFGEVRSAGPVAKAPVHGSRIAPRTSAIAPVAAQSRSREGRGSGATGGVSGSHVRPSQKDMIDRRSIR